MEITISEKGATICLNMIVKDESHIIQSTLEKLCNKIKFDYWVICDTGSSDNTPDIIKNFFQERGINGEIYFDEWVNFAHNRTLALQRAYKKTDLLFVFDADDELCGTIDIPKEVLFDQYHLKFGSSQGMSYTRVLLINNHRRFEYFSVIHEFISCKEENATQSVIDGDYYVVSGRSGNRSKDPNKYLNDALVLEKAYGEALEKNDHLFHRYAFYCANSYKDCGKYEDAIKWYKITLGHQNQWAQEKYVSCLSLYECYEKISLREAGFFYLVKSFSYDTQRVECIFHLLVHYCCENMHSIAYNYYLNIKDYFENNYLNFQANMANKLFVTMDKYNFFVPYYMILIADKVQDFKCVIKMYEIIFTKKQQMFSEWHISNLFYNLKFFLHYVSKDDNNFSAVANEYIRFLHDNGVNLNNIKCFTEDYDIYTKHGINLDFFIMRQVTNKTSAFSSEQCMNSKNILFYTGFSEIDWNYTYTFDNALGGSEKAVAYLSKCFPKNYNIYVSGHVKNERVENIHYIHLNDLHNLINTTPFHTVIVSRYISFYEMFKECSYYQSYIWAHDVVLLPYGCNLNSNQILKKWNNYIKGCICLTEWHKNLFVEKYSEIKDKIHTINNGIDIYNSNFNGTNNVNVNKRKIQNKFIYSSRPDRGLNILLDLWPKITEEIPDATLTVCCYGTFPSKPEEHALKDIIDKYDNIQFLGKLSADKLYEEMRSSEFWLYPTHWPETSCITALEMLMSEVICLYYPVAGLVNTMDKYGIQISSGNEINTIINLTYNIKRRLRDEGRKYAESCSWLNRSLIWVKTLDLSNNNVNTDTNANVDANVDTNVDANIDTNVDANVDATVDANVDTNVDATVDTTVGAIVDTTVGANVDANVDANLLYNYDTNFIKIVNLERRTDRLESMKLKLHNADIDSYEFIKAVDGSTIEPTMYIKKLFANNDFNYRKGVIGCALSHLNLWKQLVNDEKNDFYVVFEDDITFVDNFKNKLDNVLNIVCGSNNSVEFCLLGGGSISQSNENISDLYVLKRYVKTVDGLYGYILTKSGAKKMLDYISTNNIKRAIDTIYIYAFEYVNVVNQYLVFTPSLQLHNNTDTDIQKDYNCLNFDNLPSYTVAFTDWWNEEYGGGVFDPENNFFIDVLLSDYNINVVQPENNPDILFYSVFGDNHKRVESKRKIFYSGESISQRHDADYNITFDENSNRNVRIPFWVCQINDKLIGDKLINDNLQKKNGSFQIPKKSKFCSIICQIDSQHGERGEIVNKLSKYKPVDCGGKFLNNLGYLVDRGTKSSGKISHNNDYKFVIAFENKKYPGYVSEKIYDAYKSQSIPIYWGTPDVVKDFNPTTFINANDFNSFDELADFVVKVDNDDELYASFFKAPVFSNYWATIFDENPSFFKNIANTIIGIVHKPTPTPTPNKERETWVFFPDKTYKKMVIEDYLDSYRGVANFYFINELNDIPRNANKIFIANHLFENSEATFDKFPNSEISMLITEQLTNEIHLNCAIEAYNKRPNMKFYSYSKSNIKILNENNITNTEFLPYFYNDQEINFLKYLNDTTNKEYDFGIICYTPDIYECIRKQRIVSFLRDNNFKVNVICGWKFIRDVELSKCKVILNVHTTMTRDSEDTFNIFEHIRCDRLLYADFKVLSEESYCLDEDFINKFSNSNLKIVSYKQLLDINTYRNL
jgi:GR25 family glycosyltransferase involved in LPS biosynthesis